MSEAVGSDLKLWDVWRGCDSEVAETKEENLLEIININFKLIICIAYYIVIGRHSIDTGFIQCCTDNRYSTDSILIPYFTIDRFDVTSMSNKRCFNIGYIGIGTLIVCIGRRTNIVVCYKNGAIFRDA